MTYQEIADELGYANRGTVYRLVQAALTPELQDDVETHRRLGRDRLDALQVDIFLGWQRVRGSSGVETCHREPVQGP